MDGSRNPICALSRCDLCKKASPSRQEAWIHTNITSQSRSHQSTFILSEGKVFFLSMATKVCASMLGCKRTRNAQDIPLDHALAAPESLSLLSGLTRGRTGTRTPNAGDTQQYKPRQNLACSTDENTKAVSLDALASLEICGEEHEPHSVEDPVSSEPVQFLLCPNRRVSSRRRSCCAFLAVIGTFYGPQTIAQQFALRSEHFSRSWFSASRI